MLDLVKSSSNGNGLDSINGRGLAHRKLTRIQRRGLAADLATGQQYLVPSLSQVADLLKITPAELREELKVRAQREAEAQLQTYTEAQITHEQATAIVETWQFASPDAREAAVRIISPSAVWDVISRIVS
jgi:hypothetical protein